MFYGQWGGSGSVGKALINEPQGQGSFWPHVKVSLIKTPKSHSSAINYVQLSNNNL